MVSIARHAGALAVLAALLAACEPSAPVAPSGEATRSPPVRAAGFDYGPVKAAAEYLAEPAYATADVTRGELLALACAACHRFQADQGAAIGPNLQGVFGRAAASVAGFDYSPALRSSGLVWTPRSLEAWLADPAGFVEGTTMAFTGYRSPEDRRALIAYLLKATD